MTSLSTKALSALSLSCALFSFTESSSSFKGDTLVRDHDLIQGKFSNGLSYYIKNNRFDQKKASLRLVVKVGSILEEETERGIAHFIEHMVFRGSENFKDGEVVKYLESIGASFGGHTNAYTSFDETVYMFDIPLTDKQNLKNSLQILSEFATKVSFLEECLNIEKGVVLDELRLRKSHSQTRGMEMFSEIVLKDSLYGQRLPIGKELAIQSWTREDVLAFYKKWYQPDNMAVIAVGDFDPQEVFGQVQTLFSDIFCQATPRACEKASLSPFKKIDVEIVSNPDHPRSLFYITKLIDATSLETFEDYKKACLDELIFLAINRRLDHEKENNASFEIGKIGSAPFPDKKDLLVLYGVCWDKAPLNSIESFLREYKRGALEEIFESELYLVKADLKAQLSAELENADKITNLQLASQYLAHFLKRGSIFSNENQKKLLLHILEDITPHELNKRRKELFEGGYKCIYFPSEQSTKVSCEDIKVLLEKKYEKTKEAFVNSKGTLFSKEEKKGSIVAKEVFENTKIEALLLSNGMRVFLQPTELKKNIFSVQFVAKGGLDCFEETSYCSASVATDYLKKSGLAGLSASELQDYLSGKNLQIQPYLSLTERGVLGYSSNQDMHVFFSLLNAFFKKRDLKESAWKVIKETTDQHYGILQTSSEMKFKNAIYKNSFCNHFFFRPFDSSFLEEKKAATVLDLFFADPSKFTLLIAGDYEKNNLEEALISFVATLEKKGEFPEAETESLSTPFCSSSTTIESGASFDESHLVLHFPLKEKSQELEPSYFYKQELIDNILSRRLLEHLRLKVGETYGIYLSTQFLFYPKMTSGRLTIQCSIKKGKEEWMIEQVLGTLGEILDQPISLKDLEKAINIYLHKREKHLLTNEGRLEEMLETLYFSNDFSRDLFQEMISLALDPNELQDLMRNKIDKTFYTLTIRKG